MNGFQLVKTVLDELYEQIYTDYGENRDTIINNKLDYLGETYRQLIDGNQVIYSDPVTRFAYIYRYTTAHADIAYQLIYTSEELRKLFDKKRVQIACLGGGPGSDLLGVLKYILQRGPESLQQVICTMWDQEDAWADSWVDINNKLDVYSPNISTFFRNWSLDKISKNWPVEPFYPILP